jgi:hypothetical protein
MIGQPAIGGGGMDRQGGRGGLIRVVSGSEMATADRTAAETKQASEAGALKLDEGATSDLAGYVRRQFEIMVRHRQSSTGWNDRLIAALRMFKGEYEAAKLAQIQLFGGSDVYARLVAVKCRGATALLRDIYLGPDRPWGIRPTPDPTMPDNVSESISTLLETEVMTAMMGGEPVNEESISARRTQLMQAAREAAIRKAADEAKRAQRKIDDILVEGGFYTALAEFLVDLPLFPFAVFKGPVVRISPRVKWVNKKAQVENVPRMYWERISPFDIWWSPGVSNIADADVAERLRLTRADINGLMGLPGYKDDAIKLVLEEYGQSGHTLIHDTTDSIRANAENREDPQMNETGIIEALEFHGSIQGKMLKDWGVKGVKDELRDYCAVVWVVGRHVIKATLSPSPRKRHPYFVTSFEKVPGTSAGNALPDIISDLQDVCNATLRSLVNNIAMASGPQVVINVDRLADGADGDSIYPWKRWFVENAPGASNTEKAVDFMHPNMHAMELLGVFEKFVQIADEISAIPRYVTGSERAGGAGRTASGLAMLMGNASKVLQTVAANIDRDVFEPCLQALYDILMLTSSGDDSLTGDESIEVRGVNVAIQRETERQRQLEFLNNTNNPTDIAIIGPEGRAEVLRAVSTGIGLDGSKIVPSGDDLKARQQAEQAAMLAQQQMAMKMGAPPGAPPGAPQQPPSATGPGPGPMGTPAGTDAPQGPRTNLQQQAPQGQAA